MFKHSHIRGSEVVKLKRGLAERCFQDGEVGSLGLTHAKLHHWASPRNEIWMMFDEILKRPKKTSFEPELNQRPKDICFQNLQSSALPTELSKGTKPVSPFFRHHEYVNEQKEREKEKRYSAVPYWRQPSLRGGYRSWSNIESLEKHLHSVCKKVWRCRGLNSGPHTCKACALPLSYIPLFCEKHFVANIRVQLDIVFPSSWELLSGGKTKKVKLKGSYCSTW